MTGFGRGEAALGAGRAVAESRSVNHRAFEVRVHGPKEALPLSGEIGEIARRRAQRGRFEVHLWIDGDTGTRAVLDRQLARDAFRALASLRDELAPGEPVPLSLLAAVPDLFGPAAVGPSDDVRRAILEAVERSLAALDLMREREGVALATDLASRLGRIRGLRARVAERAPDAVEQQRRRLRDRVERLAADPTLPLDPARLEQEVALIADRTDIAEELTRLASHSDQVERLLAEQQDPVGRKLDFLLQELAREANTIGAKSQDVVIAHLVVELKTEIERMREQAQNVE
jgi:uncharacterized protein (TIGR00255 family)